MLPVGAAGTMYHSMLVEIGGKVKRKRVLAKYEDIANVPRYALGTALGINAPDDFKEELAKRLDYFRRRQR